MYTGIKNSNSNQNKYSKLATQEVESVGSEAKDGRYLIPDKAKNIADQVKAKNGAAPKGFKGGKLY